MRTFVFRGCFKNTYNRRLAILLLTGLSCFCSNITLAQFGIIGTGSFINSDTTYPTPFGAYYSGQRAQYLYNAAELNAVGLAPGLITTLGFYVKATNGAGAHDMFRIRLANTALANLTSWVPGGLTNVYYSNSFTPVPGWNLFPLQTPFFWSGSSNVIMEVCHWNGASTSTFNASVLQSAIVFSSSANAVSHTADPCGNNSLTPRIHSVRPNLLIGNVPACSGQPSAGTLIPSGTVAACPANAYTITAVNYSIAYNTSFRWKQSTDGGLTWVPVVSGSGDTTIIYATPPLTADSISYHMVITCLNSGLRDSTANVTFSITKPVYAALPFSESFENWISRCDSSDAPSIHWTTAPYTGNSSWRRDDSGALAGWWLYVPPFGVYTPAAIAGLHSARFHAHAAPTGPSGAGNLAAYLDCSSVAGMKDLAFYMRTDTGRIQPADSLFVDLSTNSGATFTTIGAYGPGTGGWDLKNIAFASDSPKTVIRFRAHSRFQYYSDIGIDSVTVLPPVGTGIASARSSGFSIAPNPAGGFINIYSNGSGLVQLIDIIGREVKSITLPEGGGMTTVRLEGISPGLYTYRYMANGMLQSVGKLIIAQ